MDFTVLGLIFGVLFGLPLLTLGVIYGLKLLNEVYHTRKGQFLVESIEPNAKTKKDWFKIEKGCLISGNRRIIFRDSDGFIRYGGLLGTTPIILVANGEMLNFKYDVKYNVKTDADGNPLLDETGKVLLEKDANGNNIVYMENRRESSISEELLDQFNESAIQQGRLEALVNMAKQDKYIMLIFFISVGIIALNMLIYSKITG